MGPAQQCRSVCLASSSHHSRSHDLLLVSDPPVPVAPNSFDYTTLPIYSELQEVKCVLQALCC